MIALEVSSGAGKSFGGVPGAIRNLVEHLVRLDPTTTYALCSRFSRWRRGQVLDCAAPNSCTRVLLDPLNGWFLRDAALLHSMSVFLPATPRIPKIVTIHDLNAVRNHHWVSEHWHTHRSERIELAIRRADHIVTYSDFTARELREQYDLEPSRVHPVPLGVDRARFHPIADERRAALRARFGRYVLSIGLLTPRKNFARLIEAVARLSNVNLVLIGRPSDGAEEVHAAIGRCALQARVHLLERIPLDDLNDLIAAAEVFAVPSLYEGFGLTVLEAMACETPVVCSKAASLPEVAGDAACMVDALDVDSLRAGLERVIEDRELADDLRERGSKRAEILSWSASASRLRDLYRSVAGV